VLPLVPAFNECGAVVNSDALRNEIEVIHFDSGPILNAPFSQYRVPRFTDVPVIEGLLVDRRGLSSADTGETPIVGVAPSTNAIFARVWHPAAFHADTGVAHELNRRTVC
jgi:isoquinoline 1-oxidoreductase